MASQQAHHQFRLVSPSINHEGKLARKHTDEGQGTKKNLSPPLEWYNVPEGTQSLALVVEEIDAPDHSDQVTPWTCWVVAHIPPTLKGLPEGFSGKEGEASGDYASIKEGHNDLKEPGWRGPKLPSHGNRFQFRLFALDEHLKLGNKVTKEKLLDAIEGHVIAEAEITTRN